MAAPEPYTDDRRGSSQGAGLSDISAVASPGASLGAPGALPTTRTGAQGVVSSPLASASTLAIGSSSGAADLSGIFAACREATHELAVKDDPVTCKLTYLLRNKGAAPAAASSATVVP